ncbi:MAG: hypothetical protein F6K39_31510 [Okeania sp. SIO3B3]|nr:hypothetical protein [Okeania sp. SIO3B3]
MSTLFPIHPANFFLGFELLAWVEGAIAMMLSIFFFSVGANGIRPYL